MVATQPREQAKDLERQKRESLNRLIAKQVIDTLSSPGELFQVQVRPLWDDHYRVNVYIGANAVSVKVAHSYFLKADGNGTITESSPKIVKHRGAAVVGATDLGGRQGSLSA